MHGIKMLDDGLTIRDLLPWNQIAAMSRDEWDAAQELLRAWGLLCAAEVKKPHVLALKYWGEFYCDARDRELVAG